MKKFINNVNNIKKINRANSSDSKCQKISIWTGTEACTNREISIAAADVMENSSSGTDHRSRKTERIVWQGYKKPRVWAHRAAARFILKYARKLQGGGRA